ncbi:hypothetical protein EON81_08995 [bacterium]|nr:MAG: hypothetical protein EON81_08995 [bacterium]
MFKSRIASLLLVSVLAVPMAFSVAQTATDARVKVALDRLKLKYTLTELKSYQVELKTKKDRTQLVYINSNTEKFNGVEIREVTSNACVVKGKLDGDFALQLLTDNNKRTWGAWRAVEQEGKTFVVFAVQIAADANEQTLSDAIEVAKISADDLEEKVTKADEL